MNEVIFHWVISDFDMCPQLPGKALCSPTFSIEAMRSAKFLLQLYPRGYRKTEDENYISIYLKRLNDDGLRQLFLEYEISLFDTKLKRQCSQKSQRLFYKNTKLGCSKFYERNLLLRSCRHHFLSKNELNVQCRVAVLHQDGCKATTKYLFGPDEYKLLSDNLRELFESGIHSDMTIVASGKEFKVHKAIIEYRCPKLMQKLVKLESTNIYSEPSIEAPVLMAVLKYAYTGTRCDNGVPGKLFDAINALELSDLKSSLLSHPKCVKAITDINAFKATCVWGIEDFRLLELNREFSCRLLSDETPKWTWMILSLLKTQNSTGCGYILIFDRLYTNEITFMHCKMKVKDGNNVFHVFQEFEHIFENKKEWITPFDIERYSTFAMPGLENDLLLYVEVRLSTSTQITEKKQMVFKSVYNRTSCCIRESLIYQRDLKNLYKYMKYADVILCVENEKFPAHKAILCSRSEVFCKMFSYDMEEKQKDVVKITDINIPTMASILSYMYCGDIDGPLSVDKAICLYSASDKYQLLALKDKCGQHLKSNIDGSNACDILQLAVQHSDSSLKTCALDFIKSTPKDVLNSKSNVAVLQQNPHLYTDIVNELLHLIDLTNGD